MFRLFALENTLVLNNRSLYPRASCQLGDGALALAEKVRSSIEKHDYPYDRKITVSAGVYELSFGDSVDSFIDKADRALYTAKKYGRNRVEKDIGPAG